MGFFDHDRRINSIVDGAAPPMLWYPRVAVSGCRLSLDRTQSVPSTDQTAKTVIYVVPHESDTIECWDGENWVPRCIPYDLGSTQTRAALALDISGCANATVYDVFIRIISGPWEIKYVPWFSTTVRATATGPDMNPSGLGVSDGRMCYAAMAGARAGGRWGVQPDWLYLGTFYTSAAGQTEDSAAKRFLWNAYNRVTRPMQVRDSTDTWNYSTASWRQANASSANQLAYVCGLALDEVCAHAIGMAYQTTYVISVSVGIGVDSTSSPSGLFPGMGIDTNSAREVHGVYRGLPGIGYHYLAWLEYSQAYPTTVWYGDAGLAFFQTGITGMVMA